MASQEEPPNGTMTRRELITDSLLTAALVALVVGVANAVVRFLVPPPQSAGGGEPVVIAAAAELPVGQAKSFTYQDGQYALVHTPQGFRALSRVCTHAGCLVSWNSRSQTFVCPCHAAVFDWNGNVVSGPAPRALPELTVSEVGGKVLAGG